MWFVGIDIGTTHVKVVGVTADGKPLAAGKVHTPVTTVNGRAFHDGEAVWQAIANLVAGYARGIEAEHGGLAGACIATFGQEESFPVDERGRPQFGSLAWWERWPIRALDDESIEFFDSEEHYRRSGMRLRENQAPDRITALRQTYPDVWARTNRWVDFGVYTSFRLTGEWAASTTQVSHSQLFDVADAAAHLESFTRLGVDPALFAEVLEPGKVIGAIRPEALPGVTVIRGAALVMGGHDQVLAAYIGARRYGADVIDSIGTAEYMMLRADDTAIDGRLYGLGVDVVHGWTASSRILGWGIPTGKAMQLLCELTAEGDFDRFLGWVRTGRPVEGLRFDVNDLRDDSAGLISIRDIPAGRSVDDVVATCVAAISGRFRRVLDVMCEATGITPRSVLLIGSLFHRDEMIDHRRDAWRLPVVRSEIDEAVGFGAAELARASLTPVHGGTS